MTTTLRSPRLTDYCPEYRDALKRFDALSRQEDLRAAEREWERVQEIAAVFRRGVELGQRMPRAERIRAWRAGG